MKHAKIVHVSSTHHFFVCKIRMEKTTPIMTANIVTIVIVPENNTLLFSKLEE